MRPYQTKGGEHKDGPQWKYKERAISEVGKILKEGLRDTPEPGTIIVPIPPSKPKKHPLYDDRHLQALKGLNYDVRELIMQNREREPLHGMKKRYRPSGLKRFFLIDESLVEPKPKHIVLFDDLLVSGTHFRVIKDMFDDRFPEAIVCGVFVARRVKP